jgi:hypothetical protein
MPPIVRDRPRRDFRITVLADDVRVHAARVDAEVPAQNPFEN